jgi:hypothetical protein
MDCAMTHDLSESLNYITVGHRETNLYLKFAAGPLSGVETSFTLKEPSGPWNCVSHCSSISEWSAVTVFRLLQES